MYNPFEHLDDAIFSNMFGGLLFGLPNAATVNIGGEVVPSATPFHPETVRYYLEDVSGDIVEVTHDQVLIQQAFLHAAYGAPIAAPGGTPFMNQFGFTPELDLMTPEEAITAIRTMPNHVQADLSVYSDVDLVAYCQVVLDDWM